MPHQPRTLPPSRPPVPRPWDLAADAAEAIRALNHATAFAGTVADAGAGYEHPADLDATLVELSLMAVRLPQALAQARTWLTGRYLAGTVGHDTRPGQVDAVLAEVGQLLNDAIVAAGQLADSLDQARQHTAHLTTRTEPVDRRDRPETGEQGGAR
jgi:hypothetical protein